MTGYRESDSKFSIVEDACAALNQWRTITDAAWSFSCFDPLSDALYAKEVSNSSTQAQDAVESLLLIDPISVQVDSASWDLLASFCSALFESSPLPEALCNGLCTWLKKNMEASIPFAFLGLDSAVEKSQLGLTASLSSYIQAHYYEYSESDPLLSDCPLDSKPSRGAISSNRQVR